MYLILLKRVALTVKEVARHISFSDLSKEQINLAREVEEF
jgi:hypothetical protein